MRDSAVVAISGAVYIDQHIWEQHVNKLLIYNS